MHWRFLTSKATNFDTLIGAPPNIINDYKTTDPTDKSIPPDGYGPNHAFRLAKLPLMNKKYPSGLARKNADNYAWLASTVFWRKTCQNMVLKASSNNDDNYPACIKPQSLG